MGTSLTFSTLEIGGAERCGSGGRNPLRTPSAPPPMPPLGGNGVRVVGGPLRARWRQGGGEMIPGKVGFPEPAPNPLPDFFSVDEKSGASIPNIFTLAWRTASQRFIEYFSPSMELEKSSFRRLFARVFCLQTDFRARRDQPGRGRSPFYFNGLLDHRRSATREIADIEAGVEFGHSPNNSIA